MVSVEAFMADLDTHIAGELAALQARGADRFTIEVRHKELCDWAIDQCGQAEARSRLISDRSSRTRW